MKHPSSATAGHSLPQVKSISALRRGLDVLQIVATQRGLGLHELHSASGIPKASLLRILRTLEEAGQVERRAGDGAYVSRARPARETQTARSPQTLAEVASQSLRVLRERMDWPSDLAVRHGLRMRVIDSNRALYGLAWRRRVIGAEVDMLGSALGRAYLAFCPAAEREELLAELLPQGSARARRREWLEQVLARTRRCGYGSRDALYAGPDADGDSRLSAIAVPVLHGDQVVACLSCVWQVGSVELPEVITGALAQLVRQAADMERRL